MDKQDHTREHSNETRQACSACGYKIGHSQVCNDKWNNSHQGRMIANRSKRLKRNKRWLHHADPSNNN